MLSCCTVPKHTAWTCTVLEAHCTEPHCPQAHCAVRYCARARCAVLAKYSAPEL